MPTVQDIQGEVFKNASVILLARIVGEDGGPVTQATISSISYTIYELDEADPDSQTPVSGHTAVSVSVANSIFDELQLDELWSVDSEGYNFKHVVDISQDQAFAQAGIQYQVRFELTPTTGQVIIARFKLRAL